MGVDYRSKRRDGNDYIYHRIFGYAFAIALHVGNLAYIELSAKASSDVEKDPILQTFTELQNRFFTVWTFFCQILYAIIGLLCELLTLWNFNINNYQLPKLLRRCRDGFFAAIVWPTSVSVFTVFWSIYLYDREFIFPRILDKVLSTTSNHIMHTAIFPIVLWEVIFRPRKEPRSHTWNLSHLSLHVLVYLIVFVYTYVERGVWIYPIFKFLYGTIYFPMVFLSGFISVYIFYRLQWLITYLIWCSDTRVNEKIK